MLVHTVSAYWNYFVYVLFKPILGFCALMQCIICVNINDVPCENDLNQSTNSFKLPLCLDHLKKLLWPTVSCMTSLLSLLLRSQVYLLNIVTIFLIEGCCFLKPWNVDFRHEVISQVTIDWWVRDHCQSLHSHWFNVIQVSHIT